MSEWKEYKLGEVYDFSSGLSKAKEFFGKGFGFVSFKDVFYKYFLPEQLTELVMSNPKEQISCSVKKGDVFLTRTSETMEELGMSTVALKDYPLATFNGFTKRLRPKYPNLISPKFAGYYFRSPLFRATVSSFAIMTTRASLNNEILGRLTIILPQIKIQETIGEILKSLDDKIELNNKINQELEALAQTLFKQWFIDFEFPNENKEPYKSSGGEMLESELGEIPKGWEVGKFDNLVRISSGKGIKKKDYQEKGGYSVIGANGIMGYYKDYNIDGFKILTGRVGTLGTVRISNEKAWTSDNVLICEPFVKEYNHYSYFVMKDFDFNALNRGSTQPLIAQTDLKSQIILLPEINILTIFQNQMEYFLSLIELNKIEIRRLTNLRDTLLPKLISGELEINEIAN